MGAGPITFDYNRWLVMFPELSGITSAALYSIDASGLPFGYWVTAGEFIRNDGGSPVQDPVVLADLLYLTTAHLVYLLSPRTNGVPTTGGTELPSQMVGRINTATEGSVSVGSELPGNLPAAAAWWAQTSYGFTVWGKLAPYRTMRYILGPRRIYNPPIWLRGGRPGYW